MPSSFFNFDIPCPSCGYNLRGLSLDRGCPECGLKITAEAVPNDPHERLRRIEAEVAENLQLPEEPAAQQRRVDEIVLAWGKRGERFDTLLNKLEAILERLDSIAAIRSSRRIAKTEDRTPKAS